MACPHLAILINVQFQMTNHRKVDQEVTNQNTTVGIMAPCIFSLKLMQFAIQACDFQQIEVQSSSALYPANNTMPDREDRAHFFFLLFLYIFWRARVCRPLLRLCRPFMIFEGCLDSNSNGWRATDLATHPSTQPPIPLLQPPIPVLSHPSLFLATHHSTQPPIPQSALLYCFYDNICTNRTIYSQYSEMLLVIVCHTEKWQSSDEYKANSPTSPIQ